MNRLLQEQHVSTICYNCHNEYVWQLAGFNRTNEVLYETIIPELLNVCWTKFSSVIYSPIKLHCAPMCLYFIILLCQMPVNFTQSSRG
jgi:hypothetical protein